jgi:hypothetical protein
MSATTVSADVMNPFGGSPNHRDPKHLHKIPPSINLTVKNVPKDMVVILLLDEDNSILQIARSDETIRIVWPSTLYLAVENKLSNPFNYDKDKKKLFKLKQYQKKDLPSSEYHLTAPIETQCTVKTVGSQKYSLVCK